MKTGLINMPYKMWHTVARWSAGILKDFPEYSEINKPEVMKDSLKCIASINLKKVTGGSTAGESSINAFAHQDRVLLVKQIREIGPNIIVAAGTFNPLIWLLDLTVDARNPIDKKVRCDDNTLHADIIPFGHPASRKSDNATYNKLKELIMDK